MPNVNGTFQGQTLIRSAAYYADDVSSVTAATPPSTPPLLLIGNAYGTKPFVPHTYSGGNDLLSAIRGGPVSGLVQFLTSPSGQLNGAQQITLINVAPNTQSTYTASAGSSGVITFTSADYGAPSNQLQVQITAGTIAGKNVSLFDLYSNTSPTPGVNLGVPFQLSYTGASTGVSYSVTTSGGSATVLTITSPVTGESQTIQLSSPSFATVQAVTAYLNSTGFYVATVISQGTLPSTYLDAATTVSLPAPSGGVNQPQNVYATLGDIVWWCNNNAASFATAAIVNGVTSSSGMAPTNIPFTFFSGATSVTPSVGNYASGFTAGLSTPAWTVVADNNSSGVVALGTQHAITASAPNVGKWRRFFSGSSVGDSISTAVQTAQQQNSITTCYVYPGIYRNDPVTGVNTLYGGLYAAAAAAGMATGNTIPTPLTNKALTANGLEVNLTDSQINQLQQSGVMTVILSTTTNLATINADLTTWQQDSNPENVYTQQIACRWQLAYLMQAGLSPYAGTVASNLTEINILNAAKAVLNSAIYSQANQNGVINSWEASSLRVVYSSNSSTSAVTVNVTLVGQNRFVTIFVPIQPLNITISAGVNGQSGGLPL